ncbi:CGNR zinc finger domain-containing protein [Streptomyces liangshanensis]|uniref:CGNR zinc finger domain-containing protein n=1 Tax=Streptomyces liangshanensis TaxID=2717324 RepID=A0A6G9H7L4_9ACTN|nr:CGNR zinc finger domain-containing protein [Streptomyces liangshanensis]QIQ06296.1 CGNR zinc finger domain-containing protein [Streptomyces liangshanensis]
MEDSVVVDLLNTTPVVDGRTVDRLADDAAADAWLTAHGGGTGGAGERAALRSVRRDLQAVVRGQRPATILNAALADVGQHPVIDGDGLRWDLYAPPERALPARIVLAWAALSARMPGRLRPCANDECDLFLLDRSRSNTARWCSMTTCGNRLKARRHQARRTDA